MERMKLDVCYVQIDYMVHTRLYTDYLKFGVFSVMQFLYFFIHKNNKSSK